MCSISGTGGEILRYNFRYLFPDPHFLRYLTHRVGEVGNEGGRMVERVLVSYRNGDSVDMLNFNAAKFCFVLWSIVGIYMFILNRSRLSGILFHIHFPLQREKE